MTLAEWMERNERNAAWLARKLTVSHPTARRLIAGKTIPRPALMRQIVDLTDGSVGPNDFYAASEDQAEGAAA